MGLNYFQFLRRNIFFMLSYLPIFTLMQVKMKTRERIIAFAVDFFNQKGFQKSSLKSLATAMGISDGNLRYHFRTKGDLAMAIYLQMHDRINKVMQASLNQKISLKEHFLFIRGMFKVFWDYRFTQIEAARIMESYPGIGVRHNEIYLQRKAVFQKVLQTHIENGEIVLPEYPGIEDYLFDQYFIIAGSWIRFALLEQLQDEDKMLDHFAEVNLSLFIPFLSEFGRKQMQAVLPQTDE